MLAIGVALPTARTVLIALGGTFLFAAIMVLFLITERCVRESISEHIYANLVANEAALIEAYNSQNSYTYVPQKEKIAENDTPAWLLIPRYTDRGFSNEAEIKSFPYPGTENNQSLFLLPTGGRLFREFESMLSGDLSESPNKLAVQLADGITNGLGLADSAKPHSQPIENYISFEIDNGLYDSIDPVDHPIQSFLAVGLAVGLDRPITAEIVAAEAKDNYDYLVKCRWEDNEGFDDAERFHSRQQSDEAEETYDRRWIWNRSSVERR
jgi:hypothetical protein